MKSEWHKATIADLGSIVTGKTPTTKVHEFWNGEILFITPKDIQSTKHIIETERKITNSGLESVKSAVLPPKAICVSCIGNIGYVAMTTKRCVSNQQINSIVVNEKNDADFVYYLMLSMRSIFKNYEGQSTALSILNKSQFSKVAISIPDKTTQEKISNILSSIDEKIELNNAINNNLEQQAQALYKAWFVDFEPFKYELPSDWCNGTVDDLATKIICGKTPSTKIAEYYGDDMPFITIPDMHNSTYVVSSERQLSTFGANSQSGKTLPVNSVCVSCIGTAGLVSLVSVPSQTNQQINSIIPKEGISPYYIYLLMKTLSETINKLGQSGSTIVNLNKTLFGKIPVLIPSASCMLEFNLLMEPLFQMILSNQQENLRLAEIRDAVLPRLMSGEFDVSDIDL